MRVRVRVRVRVRLVRVRVRVRLSLSLSPSLTLTLTKARLGASSRRALTTAVVAISSAFPIGALASHPNPNELSHPNPNHNPKPGVLASHAVLEHASSDTGLNVVRTMVAKG